ncbi:MAG: hypothetical protein V4684_17290 [Pseudomonadota bacterium]
MHSAPSVTYPVGRSRFAGVAVLVLWLLGAATVCGWWLQAQAPGWRTLAALIVVVGSGVLAAMTLGRSHIGSISWDGEKWKLPPLEQQADGAIEVALDLQRWILLQAKTGAGSQWLWVERSAKPERWDDMRRAVYSRARPQAERAAAP